jgi:hypothetical protein
MRNLKRLAAFLLLSLLAVALMAAPAFATGTTPIWQNPGKSTWTGTLTLKKNGGSAVNCTIKHSGDSSNGEGPAEFDILINWLFGSASCSNGKTFSWVPWGEARYNTITHAFSLQLENISEGFVEESPWGGQWGMYPIAGESTMAYTNGSGATPSKVTFNETRLGITEAKEVVRATGTLSVVNSSTKQAEILTLK